MFNVYTYQNLDGLSNGPGSAFPSMSSIGLSSLVDHVTGFSGMFRVGNLIALPMLLRKSLIELGHSGSLHTSNTSFMYSGSGTSLCRRYIRATPSGKDTAEGPVTPLSFLKSQETDRTIRRANARPCGRLRQGGRVSFTENRKARSRHWYSIVAVVQ